MSYKIYFGIKIMKINKTIVDNVYIKLMEDIAHLKIKPGERIDILKISIDFGVSQTPIREALGRLVKDGLVVCKSRKGEN